eukprot:Sspe_Gene.62809::Locus_35527_Transcript_2_2_Confidence_0.667_Length_460::g.62809::m.62809
MMRPGLWVWGVLLAGLASNGMTSAPPYRIEHIEQPVDHANALQNTTFMQRYLINDSMWTIGGPILAFTGAEGGDIEDVFYDYQFMFQLGCRKRALMLFIEHRYFGKSYPFGAVEQALDPVPSRIGYLSV